MNSKNVNDLEWIECNVVWHLDGDYPSMPFFDHKLVEQEAITKFGFVYDEGNYGEVIPTYDELSEERRRAALSIGVAEDHIFDDVVKEKMSEWPDEYPHWKTRMKIKEKLGRYWDWLEKHSAYLAYQELVEKTKQDYKGKTFVGQNLNKPGTLIELEDGSQHLIGSVNTNRGVCDDCTAFERDAIVKRYAVVFELLEKNKEITNE